LREGVKFQDNTPFNAEAVKYNVDIQLTTPAWMNLKAFEKCEVVNEYTVKMTFKGGKFDWPAFRSFGYFFSCLMFSPTFLKNNTEDYKRTHVVGTGPFKLVEFNRDESLIFDRFDDYWRGKPYVEGIDYKIIPDATTQLIAYEAGEVDTLGVQAKDRADLEAKGFEVIEMPATTVVNLCLIPSSNNPDSPLANVDVRRALEYAMDKDALVEGIAYGLGQATYQIYIDTEESYATDCVGYHYDVAKAKALLEKAGYGDGFKTSIVLVDFLPLDLPLAIQDMWSKIGVETEINRISILQINEMVSATGSGWEGWFYAFAMAGPGQDPGSDLINGPINYNTTWVSNWEPPELIELAKVGSSEFDVAKRYSIYQELSKKMTDTYAQWLWMYYPIGLFSISPRVKGDTTGQGVEFFAYTFAYVNQ
jgi:peptide/nickel transport system substrate-binding protein